MKKSATAKGKTNHNPGWKARVQAKRREDAEARNQKYATLPLTEKLKRSGEKQKKKLLNTEENA